VTFFLLLVWYFQSNGSESIFAMVLTPQWCCYFIGKGYIAAFDCEGHVEKAIAKSVLPFGKVV
jgi:hypothetical protein